ncbi:hypothetical protein HK096_005130 [Nowakowskiella sp. JEL0078]|nr:hypothetical protein HK096_005130 [Nowakowskiella sp. JEL0078]
MQAQLREFLEYALLPTISAQISPLAAEISQNKTKGPLNVVLNDSIEQDNKKQINTEFKRGLEIERKWWEDGQFVNSNDICYDTKSEMKSKSMVINEESLRNQEIGHETSKNLVIYEWDIHKSLKKQINPIQEMQPSVEFQHSYDVNTRPDHEIGNSRSDTFK